jgi:hypothetical protein
MPVNKISCYALLCAKNQIIIDIDVDKIQYTVNN